MGQLLRPVSGIRAHGAGMWQHMAMGGARGIRADDDQVLRQRPSHSHNGIARPLRGTGNGGTAAWPKAFSLDALNEPNAQPLPKKTTFRRALWAMNQSSHQSLQYPGIRTNPAQHPRKHRQHEQATYTYTRTQVRTHADTHTHTRHTREADIDQMAACKSLIRWNIRQQHSRRH